MRALWAALIALVFLRFPCQAVNSGDDLKNALPQEAYEILEEVDPGATDVKGGFSALWKGAAKVLRKSIKGSVKSAFQIVGICLLLSMADAFAKSAGTALPNRLCELIGSTAILLSALQNSGSLLALCQSAIVRLESFTKLMISVFTVASISAGRPASAMASAGAAMLFSEVILTLAIKVFLPGITLYLFLIYGGIVGENGALRQAASVGKWALTSFFKVFLTAYFAYLTFTGLVTGSADAAAVRTAQNLSGAVPLVGSVIAGASDTILAGASLLRAATGLFGTLGAAAICLTPFVQGVCYMLSYRVLAVFAASFAEGGTRAMLDGLSNAYSMLLGSLAACCAVQFITIVVCMTVTGT